MRSYIALHLVIKQNRKARFFLANLFVLLAWLLVLPASVFASQLTSPLTNYQVVSWFDHDYPGSLQNNNFTRYDGQLWTDGSANLSNATATSCTNGINCYDRHNGIDLFAVTGTPVFAAENGVVQLNTTMGCNGKYVTVLDSEGNTAFYTHLDYATIGSAGTPVLRFQQIGVSGSTGCTTGPHLHFGIHNSGDLVIDPYGWSPSPNAPVQIDPWVHNQGYLWTTNPPSLNVNPATYVSGVISQNTIWTAQGSPYVIQNNLTVSASTTLTINPGVVVKFDSSASLYIYGTLLAQGGTSSTTRVYFTSIKDDSIGGDTNNDGATTTPAVGDYMGIYFYPSSIGNLTRNTLRYGGNDFYPYHFGVIKNLGGSVTLANSEINSNYGNGLKQISGNISLTSNSIHNNGGSGFEQTGGMSTTTNSTFSGNQTYGIFLQNGTSTITSNIFSDHGNADININAQSYFNQSGNVSSGIGKHGIEIYGSLTHDQVWNPGIPFIPQNMAVNSGKSLTILPGSVIKFDGINGNGANNGGFITVYGHLIARENQLQPNSPQIYFTSYVDDTIGGDTNGNGTTTVPYSGIYQGIYFYPGSTGLFQKTALRYGGASYYPYYAGVIKNFGGEINIQNSNLSLNSPSGIYQASGTTTISGTLITDNVNDGFSQNAGVSTVTNSIFSNNQFFGLNLTGGTSTINQTMFSNHLGGDIQMWNNGVLIQSNLQTSGTGKHGIRVAGGMTNNQTWTPGLPYVMSSFNIFANANLSVAPATVIKFEPGGSLYVFGTLQISTTSPNAARVYLTSVRDDTLGGDSDGDGRVILPAPGDYTGIYAQPGSLVNLFKVEMRYGGSDYYPYRFGAIKNFGGLVAARYTNFLNNYYQALYQMSGTSTIVSSLIASSTQNGINQLGGGLTVANTIFSGNSGYGLNLSDGFATVTSSSFNNNQNGDAFINGLANFTHANNTFLGGKHGWYMGGYTDHDWTWSPEQAYIINPGFLVASGTSLTVQPNTIIKGIAYGEIAVAGTVNMNGIASTSRIFITSLKDDSIGGDTNADSNATTPQSADYNGLTILPGGSANLNQVLVKYGGGGYYPNYWGAIKNLGGNLFLANDILQQNQVGIYTTDGTTSISQSSIYSNTVYGILNQNSNATVTAQSNWWGDASGPHNWLTNTGGSGNEVLGNVLFTPWLVSDPN